ncbi:glycosyltransferase [Stutzerimonas stutzeri]|uniref:glycosyltransferase n=1 Tax=Stutzerimonas stutzeri TaxID=316 RepID=UPI0024487930|nr:glycosyltransferase [Stutzerimonas stutzeri]MDH0101601.1 glycosyltransferase [Stutzerimonas stutzeri]
MELDSPKVAVLLAAFNGMRWLETQVVSILGQQGVAVVVYISVDQSTDETLTWCQDLASKDPRVIVLPYTGERFGGAAKNFFRLIRDVDFRSFDYVAYADQDDIYCDNKYRAAHEAILKNRCAAYSSNVTAVWPDGRRVLIVKSQPQRKYDFLFEAGGPGCSYVLRVNDALEFKNFLLVNWSAANEVSLHDWLTYAWFRSSGRMWFIDERSYMLYRQHGGNQLGVNHGAASIKSRLELLRSGWYRGEISKISKLVGHNVPGLPFRILDGAILPKRFLIRNYKEFRRSRRDQLAFGILALLGLI